MNSIITNLPLLDYLNTYYQIDKKRPFAKYKILAVQHLLGSTIPLFSSLQLGGAKPENIYIVGKAYSSHPEVVNYLIKQGSKVNKNTFDFIEDGPYDSILERNIKQSLDTMIEETDFSSGNIRGLIIDDGGKAVKMLHEQYSNLAKYFSCVEQTSRGVRTIQTLHLQSPVINVARSDAKTLIESPLIAESMVNEFLESLKHWEDAIQLRNKNVVLLGYGFIGENVARQLINHNFNIVVYDSDFAKMQRAQERGLTTISDRSQAISNAQIIVGCSGTCSLPENTYSNIQPGSLIVNMASTDTEFAAWNLRRHGQVVHERKLPSDGNRFLSHLPWRSLYKIITHGTHFYLANGGFPIDFSGDIDPIPPNKIQLTRALLMQAAIQAVSTQQKGLVDLDHSMEKKIVDKYFKFAAIKDGF